MTNFWDGDVWSLVTTLAILLVACLLVNILFNTFKFLRKLLLPVPVLAGFLVLAVILIYNLCVPDHVANPLMSTSTLEILTYHGLGIGFIAIALKHPTRKKSKINNTDVVNAGIITVSGYILQGIVGLVITLGLSYIVSGVFASSGMILPMGYGQGPGQAFIWGKNYEAYGFTNGASFGLAVASCGFIASAIGGAIYLSRIKHKQGINPDILAELPEQRLNRTKASVSVDNLTIQCALIFLGYIITYLIMSGLFAIIKLIEPMGDGFFTKTVNPLIWGFNFLIGMVVGTVIKIIVIKIEDKKGIEILDDALLNRVSGFSFDIMIVASMGAISLSAFLNPEFILPLSLICVAGGVITYFQVQFCCKRLFPTYVNEAFLSMFGMLTGTASTGMILLRQIDNEYNTPAANNLVYQSLYAIAFGFPLLLLMGLTPQDTLGVNGWAFLSLAIMVVMLAVYTVILFRKQIFKKKGLVLNASTDTQESSDQTTE
ncbi:MAG: hypothetical protein RR248_00340 [Clostridia bacterium]